MKSLGYLGISFEGRHKVEARLEQKCHDAIYKQKYTLKLFITFKMANYCCFSSGGGETKFSRFPPKKCFITSTAVIKLFETFEIRDLFRRA